MLKNITLSADEKLIEAARLRAKQQNSTLNAEFRRWLKEYSRSETEDEERVVAFRKALQKLQGHVVVGRKLTREEMNER